MTIQSFSSDNTKMVIKTPEFTVQGPCKQKLPLRFSQSDDEKTESYKIFVLKNQQPWTMFKIKAKYRKEN